MNRFLKRLIQFFLLLVVLVAIAITLLVVFVKPEQLKPMIISKVKALTGQTLVMDGQLSWTFFPVLGVSAGHLALSNPAGFSGRYIVEIQHAKLGVRVFPLFYGHIETGDIILQGMTVSLQKNAAGQTNWSLLQPSAALPSPSHASTSPATVSSNSTKKTAIYSQKTTATRAPFFFAMAGMQVRDGRLIYRDEVKKQTIQFSAIEMHVGDMRQRNEPFPLTLAMDYALSPQRQQGHLQLKTQVKWNGAAQTVLLDTLHVVGTVMRKGGDATLDVTTRVAVDGLHDTLTVDKLTGQLAGAPFTGEVHVSQMQVPLAATGFIVFQPFNLQKVLSSAGVNAQPLQMGKNVRGRIDFSLKGNALLGVTAEGKWQADALRVAQLLMTDVQATFRLHEGILDLLPVEAKFYQGDAVAEARVRLATAVPQTSLKLTLSGVQVQPLLQDLGAAHGDMTVTGTGNISLLVATSGVTPAEITPQLNGTAQFSLTNGAISGLNLYHMLDSAYALAKRQSAPPAPTGDEANRTPFGLLRGSFLIHHGVMTSHDLQLDGPKLAASGGGDIDLVAQKINLALNLEIKKTNANDHDNLRNLYGIPLAVQITGNLSHPVPHLDAAAIAAAFAQKELQKAVTDKVNEKAGDLLKQFLNR